jgi:hypothetical protein
VVDRSPVCPLHRKPMPRVETGGEPYHKCSQPELPYTLESRGHSLLPENER